MESKKFLVTNADWVGNKLANWKCINCGSVKTPTILSKETEAENDLEMYIKCPECGNILKVKSI